MTYSEFWGTGASGRTYSRQVAIETGLDRYEAGPELHDRPIEDPAIAQIAPGLFQIRYILSEPDRRTYRSSLWQRDGASWRIRFHQGIRIAQHPRGCITAQQYGPQRSALCPNPSHLRRDCS
ncbi:MAG: DUF4440 domain-containing protein [Pseudomonadota bacterium]